MYGCSVMKKRLSCFNILYLLLVASVCHAEETIEPTPAEYYREEGVTIVLPTEWKPYSYRDVSGEQLGYLVDLWRKWSEKSGVAIRFVVKDWSGTLESMKSGEADIHSGLYFSEERSEFLDFSDAIQSNSAILAVRDDSPVDCSTALHRGSVGVVEDAFSDGYVGRHYPEVERVRFPNSTIAVEAFIDGEADAIVVSSTPLVLVSRERGVSDNVSICRTLFYRDTHAGVQKGETELLTLINDGMNEITGEELKAIHDRWFVPVEESEKQWLKAILPAVVVLLLIAGSVVFLVSRRR